MRPVGQVAGDGAVPVQQDHTGRIGSRRPSDDATCRRRAAPVRVVRSESVARDGPGLAGQLLLGGGDGGPADEDVAAEAGDHQGGRHQRARMAMVSRRLIPVGSRRPRRWPAAGRSPSFLRSWRTWTSTVRSSPYQSVAPDPVEELRRDRARPRLSARKASRSNSRVARGPPSPATRTSRRPGSTSMSPSSTTAVGAGVPERPSAAGWRGPGPPARGRENGLVT